MDPPTYPFEETSFMDDALRRNEMDLKLIFVCIFFVMLFDMKSKRKFQYLRNLAQISCPYDSHLVPQNQK